MTDSTFTAPTATPGAKTNFLIRRKATNSREEVIAHWYGNHMSGVIQSQHERAAAGQSHARKYFVTLFDAKPEPSWDGMAQLWFPRALPKPAQPLATEPQDTFQQVVEPHMPWPTTEYVVIDGSEHLPTDPLTLNDPYPSTRSGFFKMTFLVAAKADTDFDEFFAHWLEVHAPNVYGVMHQVGGFRYVISHSMSPEDEPYAGMAELYFHDSSGWDRYQEIIQPDGMERFVDGVTVLTSATEMIGIP